MFKLIYSSTVALEHIESFEVYLLFRYILIHSKLYFEWTRVTVRAPTSSHFFKCQVGRNKLRYR